MKLNLRVVCTSSVGGGGLLRSEEVFCSQQRRIASWPLRKKKKCGRELLGGRLSRMHSGSSGDEEECLRPWHTKPLRSSRAVSATSCVSQRLQSGGVFG